VGKIGKKKQSEGVRFLLIRHSQIYTPTDCFFGDFAHWGSITFSPGYLGHRLHLVGQHLHLHHPQ